MRALWKKLHQAIPPAADHPPYPRPEHEVIAHFHFDVIGHISYYARNALQHTMLSMAYVAPTIAASAWTGAIMQQRA